MLMDRKRINRWTRWFAIIMAIVFALGTVFLGVGSYTGNIALSCAKKETTPSASSSFEDQENYYKNQIAQNPQDKDSMLILANLYADPQRARYDDAIIYYNQYLALAPQNIDVMLLLGRAQIQKADYEAAYKTLTQATQLVAQAPQQPAIAADAYYLLGLAAKNAGHNANAILAWNKVLEINPNYPGASDMKTEIARLATLPAEQPTTTTVPGSPGTSVPTGSGSSGQIPFPQTP